MVCGALCSCVLLWLCALCGSVWLCVALCCSVWLGALCGSVGLCFSVWPVALCGSFPLYTSDAAEDLRCVDLGGRRNIKKKNKTQCVEKHVKNSEL